MEFASNGTTLSLSASSPEHGTAQEEVEVAYEADSFDIGFNSGYLLDITRQIDGDTAVFMLSDAASPTIIRGAEDTGTLYVLMPMRV